MNSPPTTSAVPKFVREEHGATMVEYGLLLALLAVVAIGAIGLMSPTLVTIFTRVSLAL